MSPHLAMALLDSYCEPCPPLSPENGQVTEQERESTREGSAGTWKDTHSRLCP